MALAVVLFLELGNVGKILASSWSVSQLNRVSKHYVKVLVKSDVGSKCYSGHCIRKGTSTDTLRIFHSEPFM